MKIAFFDSGVGGLTVLNEALKKLPHEHFIYYGDSEHAPYGTKTKEVIRELVLRAVDFLAGMELKALVIACNTATSIVISELRELYSFPIIGMEPAVKLATKDNKQQRIIVCATDLTLKEEKLNKLVSSLNVSEQVDYLSLQELVSWGEHFEFDAPKVMVYLKDRLSRFNWTGVDSIVLGCTHFIYFKKHIELLIPPNVKVLDGNTGTVNNLLSKISANPAPTKQETDYYISGKRAEKSYFERYLRYLNEAVHPYSGKG